MGHLGHLKEEYGDLVERLGGGPVSLPEPKDPRAWEAWKEILEILFTPEEAALAARMPLTPMSAEKLSRRLGVPAEELARRLDAMADRGLMVDLVSRRTGEKKYVLPPPFVGFIEFSLMRIRQDISQKRLAEALDAYVHYDDALVREVFGERSTVIGRALAHEPALGDLPEVLDWERATSIIEDAGAWSVSLCYCRHKASHLGRACDAPNDNCLSIGAGAQYVARHNLGRAIDKAEALDVLATARDRGLVQIADNVLDRPTYVCNCCACCCGQLQAINEYDLPGVNPSSFLPRHDEEHCTGCSRCARACPVTAITMVPLRTAAHRKNELRPKIDDDRCIGCGLCVDACKKKNMKMVHRAERPHVPQNAVERSVRMALDRGRLADLVLETGEGRGLRFIHGVLKTIQALPATQRVLAAEQLQSRFVRMVLKQIQDPTRDA